MQDDRLLLLLRRLPGRWVFKMGAFSSEFLKIRSCFSLMRKFLSIFIMVFSFDTLLRRKYFDTLLRRKHFDTLLRRRCLCLLE